MTESERTQAYPLYVSRPLLNAEEVVAWYAEKGVPRDAFGTLSKMHVTLAYSKVPMAWDMLLPDHTTLTNTVAWAAKNTVHRWNRVFGPAENIGVLQFESPLLLRRWGLLAREGAVWEYPEYNSHVSLFTAAPQVLAEFKKLPAYLGPLEFGPERWEVIRDL